MSESKPTGDTWECDGYLHVRHVGRFALVVEERCRWPCQRGWRVSLRFEDVVTGCVLDGPGSVSVAKRECEQAARDAGLLVP